ncbi:conserved hypothetical protein [Perkinsus marinus ATCC 50983]|uniref:Dipeptidase n=1 Tax=Perkinsus marinus (strain ATCC 50983 / TXsc) TaxID=423536 RepID=C5L112_PERM5|nr:conserved hypothetical protein [Perkinsus marinus ATCC 50983]EER09654.1 conserved hypothetical protein [Perkinsus marinus ATCC 50983]|eukprot:XP_002777859.1 conserved hypothetical protein [Perkinsus marinus ATCC 50983]
MPEGTTYGYWEAAYGLMNEAGLCMGESSCSGRLTTVPIDENPHGALFWVGELASVALEICSTARGAIETMGRLAEEHGFYGTPEVEEAGEALTIADGDEAWVFHILADDTGNGAVWAAEKVPKGHATIVPNVFVIREIDPDDDQNFMFSKNLFDVAERLGWWDGNGRLDFTQTYSVGEYTHPYYAGRRLWRAFSLWAPSQNFDPKLGVEVDRPTYPFSVKPDEPITLAKMKSLYRDHMEGTQYDLTKHVTAGGAFGTPNSYAEAEAEHSIEYGACERAISLFRTQDAYIAVTHKGKPGVIHFAIGAPHASVFAPIIVKPNPSVTSIPALENTWQGEFNGNSLWWAVLSVSNMMDLKWCYMIKDVQKAQKEAEDEIDFMMKNKSFDDLEKQTPALCDSLTRRWFELHYTLLGRYQNGYTNWGYSKPG